MKLVRLLTVSNLFGLEVVQSCQHCQLCVLRENSIGKWPSQFSLPFWNELIHSLGTPEPWVTMNGKHVHNNFRSLRNMISTNVCGLGTHSGGDSGICQVRIKLPTSIYLKFPFAIGYSWSSFYCTFGCPIIYIDTCLQCYFGHWHLQQCLIQSNSLVSRDAIFSDKS